MTYRNTARPRVGAGGRGRNLHEAFESCVGEAAEYLSFLERQDDELITSFKPSEAPPDPASDWALAGLGLTTANTSAVSDWILARPLIDGENLYLPAELVVRRPDHRRAGRRMAESNGVGAGATPEQAISSGLMEVIERDAVALWWFGGRPAGPLDPAHGNLGDLQALVDAARQDIQRQTWFLDLTTDLDVPVAGALSCNAGGDGVLAGFSADPDLGVAARKAFLELCQMEFAQHLALYKQKEMDASSLKEMDRTWIERAEQLTLAACPQFAPAASNPDTCHALIHQSVSDVAHHLHQKGYDACVVDLTRADTGIPVFRVVVPGLQSAKPDWVSGRLKDCAGANGIDLTNAAKRPSPI